MKIIIILLTTFIASCATSDIGSCIRECTKYNKEHYCYNKCKIYVN